MIKGLEALVIESYTTARHYGVEDAMIATLQETFPGIDWHKQGSYFFSRVAQHGKRRAEEMREVANTVREAGFEPFMAAAIAGKHDWMAAQARAGHFAGLGQGPALARLCRPPAGTPWPGCQRRTRTRVPSCSTSWVSPARSTCASFSVSLVTRLGLFAKADMRVFGKFVINLALPALLFNALSQRSVAEILNGQYLAALRTGQWCGAGRWLCVDAFRGAPLHELFQHGGHGHVLLQQRLRGLPGAAAHAGRFGGGRESWR